MKAPETPLTAELDTAITNVAITHGVDWAREAIHTIFRRQLADQQTALAAMRADMTDMICEQHPWKAWPHEECAGPGCPVSARAILMETKLRLAAQALRERDVLAGDAARQALALESALAARPTWAEIAKLPSPVTTSLIGLPLRCHWCHAEFHDTPLHNNGCLWPRAQAGVKLDGAQR